MDPAGTRLDQRHMDTPAEPRITQAIKLHEAVIGNSIVEIGGERFTRRQAKESLVEMYRSHLELLETDRASAQVLERTIHKFERALGV